MNARQFFFSLWIFFSVFVFIFLTSAIAYAETPAPTSPITRPPISPRKKAAPKNSSRITVKKQASVSSTTATPVSSSASIAASSSESPRTALPFNSAAATITSPEEVTRRIVNFRWHPFYQMQMLTDKETLAAVRVDMDVLVSDHFSFGPSFFYRQTNVLDSQSNLTNETIMEVGLLTNFYLTNTSSEGGLILRQHAYWVDVNGTQTSSTGVQSNPTSATDGARLGLELVYQKILKCGLNFEVGGGLTYHVVPYNVIFSNGNQLQPDSVVAPTFTVGVGWAF